MTIPNIKGFLPLSMLDWPEKVSAVIFLGGCSFRCPACHNHKLVLSPESYPDQPLGRVIGYLRDRVKWIDGVTITGGEPTCHEGLPDLVSRFKELGLQVKLDTNGANPSMLETLIKGELIDAVSMDIKAPLETTLYSKLAGVSINLSRIKRSVELLKTSGITTFFRTTVIPGLIEEDELRRIREQLGDVPRYSIQRFRNLDTLDPLFRKIPDLDLERFDFLQGKFEQPQFSATQFSMN